MVSTPDVWMLLLKEVVVSVHPSRARRVGALKPDGSHTRTMWRGNSKWRWRKCRVPVSVTMCTVRSRSRATRRPGIVGHVSEAHRLTARRRTKCCCRWKWRKPARRCRTAERSTIVSRWTADGITRVPKYHQIILQQLNCVPGEHKPVQWVTLTFAKTQVLNYSFRS